MTYPFNDGNGTCAIAYAQRDRLAVAGVHEHRGVPGGGTSRPAVPCWPRWEPARATLRTTPILAALLADRSSHQERTPPDRARRAALVRARRRGHQARSPGEPMAVDVVGAQQRFPPSTRSDDAVRRNTARPPTAAQEAAREQDRRLARPTGRPRPAAGRTAFATASARVPVRADGWNSGAVAVAEQRLSGLGGGSR